MTNELSFDWLRGHATNLRLHGNRFLQMDLDLKGDERLHVWSDYVPFAQAYPTLIHDHAFSFYSEVLAGTLINVDYVDVSGTTATTTSGDVYDVYEPAPRKLSDTALMATGKQVRLACYDNQEMVQVLRPGDKYSVSAGLFHATTYLGFAVTLMRKVPPDPEATPPKPRVCCPVGRVPDNNFSRYQYDDAYLWSAVRATLAMVPPLS